MHNPLQRHWEFSYVVSRDFLLRRAWDERRSLRGAFERTGALTYFCSLQVEYEEDGVLEDGTDAPLASDNYSTPSAAPGKL